MATKVRKKIDIDPWDHFIDGLASEHIDKHRAWEWPKIVADLRHDHNYAIGEGQEPHWVRPGHAVLYHMEYTSQYGKKEEVGYRPTNALPIGNATQLLNYLKKGFRLRANVDPLVNVELSETADSTEGHKYDDAIYEAEGRRPGTKAKFISWDAYRNYCLQKNIKPQYEPPKQILDKMKKYDWYCLLHDHGFKSERAVKQHYTYYVRPKPQGAGKLHATVEQMKVKKTQTKKPSQSKLEESEKSNVI